MRLGSVSNKMIGRRPLNVSFYFNGSLCRQDGYFSGVYHLSGWWQLKYFFMFTPNLGGNDPNLTCAYFFSNGLVQPRTRIHRGITYCASIAEDTSILGTCNDFAHIPGEDTPNFFKSPKRKNSETETVGETPGVPSTWMCQEVRING